MFHKTEFKITLLRRNVAVEDLAKEIGINAATLHRKMNGTSDFYRDEIERIRNALDLSQEEVLNIFCR